MKLCIDCVHARIPNERADLARCENPRFGTVSFVDGVTVSFPIEYADNQRRHGACGENGEFFESRDAVVRK